MSLTRSEYLSLLSSLGVDLPPQTKLSDAALASRLKKALNMAQRLNDVLPHGVFDPSARPAWTRPEGPMQNKLGRNSIDEGLQHMAARELGLSSALDGSFLGLRQSLMGMGKAWDEGVPTVMFQDKAQTSAILMRVCFIICVKAPA
jgi:hypothetical protein